MPSPSFTYPAAVLWDMDGVLVDTAELHYQSWSQALAEVNLSLERARFLQHFGRTPAETQRALLGPEMPPAQAAHIRRRKEAFFSQNSLGNLHPTPGARDWLERFSAHSRQAVASSAPLENIQALLDILGLRAYFQALVSASDLRSKPAPDVFLAAAARLGIPPKDCLVIEDSPSGVEAACQAGIRVIAICTSNPAQVLLAADLVVPDLSHLTPTQLAASLGF